MLVVGGGEAGPRGRARGGEGRARRRARRRGRAPRRALARRASRCSRRRPRSGSGRAVSSRSTRARSSTASAPRRIVVATGATEQPLVFPGNDLVGVMLPDGVRRLVRDFSIRPGERAIVLGADDETLAIADELDEIGDRDRQGRRPTRRAAARARRARRQGARPPPRPRRREPQLRPRRRVRRAAARVLAPRAGGCAGRVRRCARRVRADRASRRCRGGRQRHRRGPLADRSRAGVPRQGQVLRVRLRGRDDEGHEARDRRGLRLDRAREALHDGDDGALPGEALPPLEHPRVRAGEPDVRVRDRDDDRPAAVGAGRARTAGRTRADADAARLDPLASRGGGRDDPVGGAVEAAVRLRRAPRGRGARRARVARGHRRLDAREAPRRGPGSRRSSSSASIRTASAT